MDFSDTRKVIVHEEYDVAVVGGGIAGVSAAVAAARGGAKALLIEKQVLLGGLATGGLISWYEPLCDGEGRQMISGIAEELIKLSVKYGFENLPAKWGGEGINHSHYDRYATNFSPTVMALSLQDYCLSNGVELRYDCVASYPIMENEICRGIVTETVGGREFFPCKFVVDATGNAAVCRVAGIPTEVGDNFFTYIAQGFNKDILEKYLKSGDMCRFRAWQSVGSDLSGNGNPKNMAPLHCESSGDVTFYVKTAQQKMFDRIKTQDKNIRDIMTLPTMPQYRKIRRIIGEYTLDGSEDGKSLANAVGEFGDFRTPGRHFQLPYTCLYNSNFPNIFAAGRIISATGDGWEITRVIPVCALTGEVAGTAAAMCLKKKINASQLNSAQLKIQLIQNGFIPF